MNSPEAAPFRLHEDPPWFLEAVNATAAATGFAPRLVERDYFCTVLLRYLAPLDGALVFKGGTCLAKVHAGFYRLSEDLDFLIPTPTDASRAVRRRQAQKLKGLLGGLGSRIPGIQLSRALEGANESAQYTAVFRDRLHSEALRREPAAVPSTHGLGRDPKFSSRPIGVSLPREAGSRPDPPRSPECPKVYPERTMDPTLAILS